MGPEGAISKNDRNTEIQDHKIERSVKRTGIQDHKERSVKRTGMGPEGAISKKDRNGTRRSDQ